MRDAIILALVFAFGAALYKFRARILIALRRFDARNAQRRFEELTDRRDRFAHYKHTLRLAEEQVEGVTTVAATDERTGMPITRFLFLGRQYATHNEAETARRAAVMGKAREFYLELDNLWLGRGAAEKHNDTTLPAPTQSETKH